jgi:rSAM/selenodomain-associated transferase 1
MAQAPQSPRDKRVTGNPVTSRHALLIIAKRPAPGQTKTRLSPPLLLEQAASLYECFLRDTLEVARAVPAVSRLVHYAPDSAAGYFGQLAPDFGLRPQVGDSLGPRLEQVLTRCLAEGFERAVIMDSDSPTLPAAYPAQAFAALDTADVVLGPCEDGGYYLIGLKQPQPRLLREVPMSTTHVLRDTLALAKQAGLRVALLPTWYDVDTAQELERLRADLAAHDNHAAHHTRAFLSQLAPIISQASAA